MGLGTALLGLGFLMAQNIRAQYGPPPQPSLWAVPGAVISTGSAVTIFCRTPPGMTRVRLSHYVPNGKWFDCTPQGAQEVFEFILQNMTHSNAGIYYCSYSKGGLWSQIGDKLELVVTGVYKMKPSLIVVSGPQGFSEIGATLLCHTHDSFNIFIFCRDGNASFPQNCSQQDHNTFLISPVSLEHMRTYRCFGSYKQNAYLWSLPSDPLESSVPGPPPQPSIWAVPGAVISTGSAVTIFCRTPPGMSRVCLSHFEPNGTWFDCTPQGAQEVCEFSLQNMTHSNAGIYYCSYSKGGLWSQIGDKLELVVTGVYKMKPSLTVDSGPQGFSEIGATLLCHTHDSFNIFIFCRDGNASFPQNCSQQDHNTFPISPVSLEHMRTYRCFGSNKQNSYLWSLPSEPLESSVPGPPPRPSLWAVPGAVISTGSAVTIFCRTPPGVTRVRLSHFVPNGKWFDCTPQGAQEVFEFSLQNMIHSNAGIYYCDYSKRGLWSQISDKLELVVTGVYKVKPSLTVDSGSQGFSEINSTLLCHTHDSFNIFILCRGGNASFPQNCSQQDHNTFLISPVSLEHMRTYRCFGSHKQNSYLWSLPSDPLESSVPGSSVPIVVGVSVAAVCLFLFLLLLFICLCCRCAKCRASNGKTRSHVKYKSSSTAMDIEEKHKYGDLEGIEPQDCRKVDAQVTAAENSQEVTYAQLCQENFRKNMNPLPSNTPQGTSTHACVYATLTLSREEMYKDSLFSTPLSTLCLPLLFGDGHHNRTMSPALPTFFCLGLCVLQVIQAQSGSFPKPSLQAHPSSLVALEQSVTLRCQGPRVVDLYRIEKLKSKKYENQDFVLIPHMKINNAGHYRCSYQNGSEWSPPSDHLELIATGVYSKPSLSAHPSSAVPPGRDVTLKCQTPQNFDQFVLYKEGDTGQYKGTKNWDGADFPITKVTAAHSGTYQCYSFSSSSPYLWSAPSDPLVLVVTGPSATPSPTTGEFKLLEASKRPSVLPTTKLSTTEKSMNITFSPEGSSPPFGFSHQHNVKGNLVRICVGAMIIVFLVGLLAEHWHSRKKCLPHRIRAVQRPLPPLPLT
ncbi:leukocyte immunoglobulin-like receptor subfamily B member 2 [Onychomys torridus]|uniref:leukocyte immunoglobulin-like receptor subfamily B member 2 n=1 Tax=Onychomys torridus TaxID=38674 RepID=UPI00167FAACD|nr:leukocyte immunoglobulin-like receptor subfamily B member 2 [Onychomys torridus]